MIANANPEFSVPSSHGEALPDHLIPLPGETAGRWALWRTVCLRGAGFPAAQVLRIADGQCAAAADRLNAVEEEAERLREAALEALRGELQAAGKDQLDRLVKAIRRVKRGQPAATEGLAEGTATAIDAWKAAAERARAERERYQAEFAASEERLDQVLRELAQDERFREAVVWQNRHAAETGLKSFLRRPAGNVRGSARDRGHAQMLASYLQRYCTKNDTIGFFGPVGWARVSESEEAVSAAPGNDLIAARQVYFEGWAIDAIADRLAQEEGIRPWLPIRRSPFLRHEGNVCIAPGGQRFQMGPLSAALMAGADGTRSARELMRSLGPDLPADREAFLWKMLADFHDKGMIRWGFQIPLSSHPERSLRETLERIEDAPLRERALELLDELERGRDAVVRAAGNPEELDRALGELATTFTRVTGRDARLGGGSLYTGRTLVYEDSRRDLDLELGRPFLDELAPALSLILTSIRWYSHQVARAARSLFAQVYSEVSQQAGSAQVDLLLFAREALPRLMNNETHQRLESELQDRWSRVLTVPEGERRVQLSSEELRPLVEREFAAPGPGWKHARVHSPDLMIAAPSLEAIRRGDYQIVLGETHLAINTLDRNLFFSQHPDPAKLQADIESDLPDPSVVVLFSKKWNQEATTTSLGLFAPSANGRMDLALRSAKDYYLDFSLDPLCVPWSQVLALGELVIEPADGSLVVKPRDGRVTFDVVDFFQFVLMIQAIATFHVARGGDHTPRVTIDRMVVARESWTFPAKALDFAQATTPEARFAAARRWAGRLGLPRFVFAKSASEGKPMYIDLESPVLVEIFAKAVRHSLKMAEDAPIRISEMLPDHDQLWLPDAQGNRYTCELRTVAIDLEA